MPGTCGYASAAQKQSVEVIPSANLVIIVGYRAMAQAHTLNHKDHFSRQAPEYSRYRPFYPPELFEYLASLVPSRALAWDCATGGGQAAQGLVQHFDRVIATDMSMNQIAHATRYPRIHYAVSRAEESTVRTDTIDLVAVAQALHWFDFETFYGEVMRVLRPGGILAVWCYGLMRITVDVDAVLDHFYFHMVGPYWPPERRHIESEYRGIPFPFQELFNPHEFSMKAVWDFDHLIGYLGTWSSVQEYRRRKGFDPLSSIADLMLSAWGPPSAEHEVRWPLHLRVGSVAF